MTIETKPVVETTMLDLVLALNRVATALEQHVLEHIRDEGPAVDLSPLPPAYNYEDQGSVVVPQVQPAQAVVAQSQPQVIVANTQAICPIHKVPFRQNSRGYYCSKKMPDGTFCKETRAAA